MIEQKCLLKAQSDLLLSASINKLNEIFLNNNFRIEDFAKMCEIENSLIEVQNILNKIFSEEKEKDFCCLQDIVDEIEYIHRRNYFCECEFQILFEKVSKINLKTLLINKETIIFIIENILSCLLKEYNRRFEKANIIKISFKILGNKTNRLLQISIGRNNLDPPMEMREFYSQKAINLSQQHNVEIVYRDLRLTPKFYIRTKVI